MKKYFNFNPNLCDGCHACQIACAIENHLKPENSFRSIIIFNERKIPNLAVINYSLSCNHCSDAPCMNNCPALAYQRDQDYNAVILDSEKCLGCRYCLWQCPYNAPKFDVIEGVMKKCTFCIDNLNINKDPACVIACPTNALIIKSDSENDSNLNLTNLPDIGIKPSINLEPLMFSEKGPKISSCDDGLIIEHYFASAKNNNVFSGIKSEFPLLIFSFLTTIVVSAFTSTFQSKLPFSPFILLSVIALSVLFGILHLGKKEKAYRIILNLKKSWLSREIFLLNIFSFLLFIFYFIYKQNKLLGFVTVGVGFLTLFSVDQIYRTKTKVSVTGLHSAETLLTALFLIGIFSHHMALVVSFGLFKMLLYILRKYISINEFNSYQIIISTVRIIFGFFIPICLLFFDYKAFSTLMIILVMISEFIDRFEFYTELEFISPNKYFEEKIIKILKSGNY